MSEKIVSAAVERAVELFRAVERAERALDARKRALLPAVSRLSEADMKEYARLTDRRL